MGTRVCSSKGTWPGQRGFTDPEERQFIADEWEIPRSRLPDDPGPGPVGIVDAVADGPPEVCWTVATNPVAGMPTRARSEARSTTPSSSRRTPSGPRPSSWRTWCCRRRRGASPGTVTNMERRISRVRAATETSPKIKQDLDIIVAIGAAIDGELFPDPRSRRSRCSTSCCAR